MTAIPVIDLADAEADVAQAIDAACRKHGFFVITGHGVRPDLLPDLAASSRRFFALPDAEKAAIDMAAGGSRWRGWFPPGGELTSGKPDGKEGIYFGAELADDDPRVAERGLLHGPNLFPDEPAELRPLVLDTLEALTTLAHRVTVLLARGLGLDENHFATSVCADPTVLLRVFHYPPAAELDGPEWGVAEHTDYGLLTLLWQDDVGGLQVGAPDGWVDVPPVPNGFVANIGDMLERMTGGRYRSTPHRVRRPTTSRISIPFFFDPSWDTVIEPLPGFEATGPAPARWDGRSVFDFDGTYGEYLTAKVRQVFPDLFGSIGGAGPDARVVSGTCVDR